MDVRCFSSPRDRRLSLCSASASAARRHPRRNSLSYCHLTPKAKAKAKPKLLPTLPRAEPCDTTRRPLALPITTPPCPLPLPLLPLPLPPPRSSHSLSLCPVYPALLCARPHAARHPHSPSLSRSCLSTSLAHSTAAAADLLKNRVLHTLSASAALAPARPPGLQPRRYTFTATHLAHRYIASEVSLHTPAPIRLHLVMQHRCGYMHRT